MMLLYIIYHHILYICVCIYVYYVAYMYTKYIGCVYISHIHSEQNIYYETQYDGLYVLQKQTSLF